MAEIGPDPTLANNSADDVAGMLDVMRSGAPAPEPAPPPAPEPPPAAAEPAAPAAEPVAEPAVEPGPSIEDQLEQLRQDREVDALEREKLMEQVRHERLLREQANTSRGALKKVASDLLREGYAPPDEGMLSEPDRPETREYQDIKREIDRLKAVEVQRSIQDAGGRFASDHPDHADYLEDMKPHVARLREEYSAYLDSGDPRLVRETTRLILKTALIDAKTTRMQAKREESKAKRAEQFATLSKAKREASPAASGGSPPERPKPKTPETMTADDAANALDSMLR